MDTKNQALNQFVEELIKDKGFPDLTPEVHNDIKEDLLRRVDEFITAKIISTLSDENVEKFEDMLKQNASDEEMQNFVTGNIPDFTNFLTQSLMEFREVYLGMIEAPTGGSTGNEEGVGENADIEDAAPAAPVMDSMGSDSEEDLTPPEPPSPAPVDDRN